MIDDIAGQSLRASWKCWHPLRAVPQASTVPWRTITPRGLLAYLVRQTAKAERLDVILNWIWNDVAFMVCSVPPCSQSSVVTSGSHRVPRATDRAISADVMPYGADLVLDCKTCAAMVPRICAPSS